MKNASQVATLFNNLCSSCLFCDKDKDILEACRAGVLSRVSNARNPTEFCLLHRPEDIDLRGRTEEEFLQNAIKVSSNKYGIIVYDESDNKTDVVKSLESIIASEYPSNRIKVILSVKESVLLDRGSSIGEYLQHYYNLGENGVLSELTLHKPEMPQYVMETEVFQKIVDSTHFISLDAGKELDPEFLKAANENRHNMEKSILFTDEERAISCLPKHVAQHFYLNYNDYRLMLAALTDEAKNTDTYFKYEKS